LVKVMASSSPARALAQQMQRAFAHLARRLVRERHGQDLPRLDPQVADQIGDAVREHARLPRAGARQDEQRPFAVCNGRSLLRIERVEDRVGHRSMVCATAGQPSLRMRCR